MLISQKNHSDLLSDHWSGKFVNLLPLHSYISPDEEACLSKQIRIIEKICPGRVSKTQCCPKVFEPHETWSEPWFQDLTKGTIQHVLRARGRREEDIPKRKIQISQSRKLLVVHKLTASNTWLYIHSPSQAFTLSRGTDCTTDSPPKLMNWSGMAALARSRPNDVSASAANALKGDNRRFNEEWKEGRSERGASPVRPVTFSDRTENTSLFAKTE